MCPKPATPPTCAPTSGNEIDDEDGNASRLAALLAEIRDCRHCVEATTRRPLPHAPRPVIQAAATARIAVCGQAPGTKVHASGMPFTDASGDRLRDWMGVTREQFYDARNIAIVPMGFCFPGQDAKGGDLPPRPECAPLWRARVMAALPRVELVLAIGLYALRWHLGPGVRAGNAIRDWRAVIARPGLPRVLPLPHPSWRNTAWLKANSWFETELLPELRAKIALVLSRV